MAPKKPHEQCPCPGDYHLHGCMLVEHCCEGSPSQSTTHIDKED